MRVIRYINLVPLFIKNMSDYSDRPLVNRRYFILNYRFTISYLKILEPDSFQISEFFVFRNGRFFSVDFKVSFTRDRLSGRVLEFAPLWVVLGRASVCRRHPVKNGWFSELVGFRIKDCEKPIQ